MTLPHSSHPVWPIIRILVRAGVLYFSLWAYYTRVDYRDFITLLTVVLADGALTGIATRAAGKALKTGEEVEAKVNVEVETLRANVLTESALAAAKKEVSDESQS